MIWIESAAQVATLNQYSKTVMDFFSLFRPLYRPVLDRSVVLRALVARDPLSKYRARYKVISGLCQKWGFPCYEEYVNWTEDSECLAIWKSFPGNDGSLMERHSNLYYLAKSVRDVRGDTAECGVYRGAGSWFILRSISQSTKTHHIFDSFEGLSIPAAEDSPAKAEAFRWKKHDLSVVEQEVRRNLSAFDNTRYYRGWIPSRFHEVSDLSFSFVHIDVDLYQPTLDSLGFFYNRVNAGGLVVCDDFGFSTCPGAFTAIIEFMEDKQEDVIRLTTGEAIITKR